MGRQSTGGASRRRRKRDGGQSILVPVAALLISLVFAGRSHAQPAHRYDTVAHEILELEQPLGAGEWHYRALEGLLDEAVRRIRPEDRDSRRKALAALSEIDSILRDQGFRNTRSRLLHEALETRNDDCDTRTTIYLSIAEVTGLPLVPVRVPRQVPGHVLIGWEFSNGVRLDWETLTGKPVPVRPSIPGTASGGSHLEVLTREEFLAIHHFNSGMAWHLRDEPGRALASLQASLDVHQGDPLVHFARAEVLITFALSGESPDDRALEEALRSANRALELQPRFSEAYVVRSVIRHYRGADRDSRRDLDAAVAANPNNPVAHLYRALSQLDRAKPASAVRSLTRAIDLGRGNGKDIPANPVVLEFAHLFRAMAYEVRSMAAAHPVRAREFHERALADARTALEGGSYTGGAHAFLAHLGGESHYAQRSRRIPTGDAWELAALTYRFTTR